MATPRIRPSEPSGNERGAIVTSVQPDSTEGVTDPELVTRLGRGDEFALRALHRRYASLVFTVAARVVDASAAEEVVQDVFMTLWRKHETFDPARGAFKAWLCQVTRRRALNALRSRGRGVKESDEGAEEIADEALEPDEAMWRAHRQAALHAAVDALPDAQRRALSLAYFDELTQEQVAAVLRVPLGTAKTRIRLAMRRIAPGIAVLAGAGLVLLLWRRKDLAAAREAREDRALTMVTSSDVVALHLGAAAGIPPETHGSYRARPGGTVAVLTASHLPPLPAGKHYVGWVRHDAVWFSLGDLEVRPDGGSLLLAEDAALGTGADEVEITRESIAGSSPLGAPVVVWPAPHPASK
jgi:RNA polymerase sigma factor (sigma-70 family)